MSNKMLIDASHNEETRVVVIRSNRIEEFDFESDHKKQLKGNIYLAKVIRIEPALQAAFVEYGGNRHGFLAFSEIHPDYYQIPITDRNNISEEGEKLEIQEDIINDDSDILKIQQKISKENDHNIFFEDETENHQEILYPDSVDTFLDENIHDKIIDILESEEILEEISSRKKNRRNYKIQEVIKKRQILLVQILKEERGSKGAALTTYLSLAGRYSVLMPKTARGGGISRKITNLNDRKRLREIVKDLSIPKGMAIILRTAGANRTKIEVKRDYDYLMRLWENVRSLTLSSVAPALVYEEGSLIKRSIRDLYNKDIEEILVSGDKGYREAKDFMRMLMPSYAKVVQPYRDKIPIFSSYDIENQLGCILQPEVSLKSGGYLVIHQTEALVSIDVNSGRSTKENSIEDTAIQTNIEASEEIARQLRLRDLAGLVVIDFIDMIEKRNIRSVEKKLRDCLKFDRARIRVGKISDFGLLEMSRQRLRTSVLESTTQPCLNCSGTGYVRSESSIALHVIRSIEEYLLHNKNHNIIVRTPVSTALYILNYKRKILTQFEENFGISINVEADNQIEGQHLEINQGTPIQDFSSKEIIFCSEKNLDENLIIFSKNLDVENLNDISEEDSRKKREKKIHDITQDSQNLKEEVSLIKKTKNLIIKDVDQNNLEKKSSKRKRIKKNPSEQSLLFLSKEDIDNSRFSEVLIKEETQLSNKKKNIKRDIFLNSDNLLEEKSQINTKSYFKKKRIFKEKLLKNKDTFEIFIENTTQSSINSQIGNSEKNQKEKKIGWWQKKEFF